MNSRILSQILPLIVFLFFGIASCQNAPNSQEYQSTSNSLADLNIKLNSDSTFKFSMRILATDEDPEEQLYFVGTWKENSNYYDLKFTGERPILNALFDLKYAEPDEFIIRNDSMISINKSKDVIMIWGVECEKLY